jgi:hypothetical protein
MRSRVVDNLDLSLPYLLWIVMLVIPLCGIPFPDLKHLHHPLEEWVSRQEQIEDHPLRIPMIEGQEPITRIIGVKEDGQLLLRDLVISGRMIILCLVYHLYRLDLHRPGLADLGVDQEARYILQEDIDGRVA